MRKIVHAMMKIRQNQINQAAVAGTYPTALAEKQITEVGDKFRYLDRELSGISPTSTNEKLSEVMTSGDFTYAIQEFVQRQALPGYQAMGFNFEPLVKPDTLPNYLAVNRYQDQNSLDDLEFVGEKGAPRAGTRQDAVKKTYSVYRWEKEYDFSHECLVNDDMGYFADQAMKMGTAARRTLEKYVSRFYTNATSITRITGFAGALYSQNGRLTSARVSECRMAFGQRVDASNEPIQADLAYIVYHRGLEDTVRQILNSELVPELATNAVNVGRNFIPIKDPYITGTAPNLPWWAFTAWQAANVVPFVLARLAGRPGPLILRKKSDTEAVTSMLGTGTPVAPIMGDFESGNIIIKVSDVFGTYIDGTEGNLFDYRGVYYSTGTAM